MNAFLTLVCGLICGPHASAETPAPGGAGLGPSWQGSAAPSALSGAPGARARTRARAAARQRCLTSRRSALPVVPPCLLREAMLP
jgi:hypothetical protein